MKISNSTLSLSTMLVLTLLIIVCCGDKPAPATTHQVFQPDSNTIGSDVRVMILKSELGYLSSQSQEVGEALTYVLNSGKLNILKVQTTYVNGYLLAAEIYYTEKSAK